GGEPPARAPDLAPERAPDVVPDRPPEPVPDKAPGEAGGVRQGKPTEWVPRTTSEKLAHAMGWPPAPKWYHWTTMKVGGRKLPVLRRSPGKKEWLPKRRYNPVTREF